MIDWNEHEGQFSIRKRTEEVDAIREEAELDAKGLERVAPGERRWWGKGYGPNDIRGLGDVVKRVTDFLGIPQCGGCRQRQETLNKLVPFGSGEVSKPPSTIPSEGKQ